MLFTEVKGSIASEIAAKEALIAQLQAEVSAHLNYAQEVQSSEVASETALQQMQMAIDMLKHINCPDGLKALERAVKEQFKEAKEPRRKAVALPATVSVEDTDTDTDTDMATIETTDTDTVVTEATDNMATIETTATVIDDGGGVVNTTEVDKIPPIPNATVMPGHIEVNTSNLFPDAWVNEPVEV